MAELTKDAVTVNVDLNKLYNTILTTHNILVYLEDNDDIKELIKIYILSFTNYSIINRDRSLKQNDTYNDIVVSLDHIINKSLGDKVFDKDILKTIWLNFVKKIKYMQNKGQDIVLNDSILAPAIESIKYLPTT